MEINKLICGDSLEVLKTFPDESIDMVCTSPPYFGLRNYGVDGQIGLEKTPEQYVAKLVEIFREVKRVLKKEGTCWLNLGDSYNGSGGDHKEGGKNDAGFQGNLMRGTQPKNISSLKPKDLIGIPWLVAFALRADGWWLRQDIIWKKENPVPESVVDRCTKAHEYIFLLAKSPHYYFDAEAIKEPNANPNRTNYQSGSRIFGENKSRNDNDFSERTKDKIFDGRNKRSVWTVNTKPFKDAHFATFPEDLCVPMVKAGCPEFICSKCGKARERILEKGEFIQTGGSRKKDTTLSDEQKKGAGYHSKIDIGYTDCGCNAGFSGGIVLDPFIGSGTTAVVAQKLNRNYIGIDLNPDYLKIAEKRLLQEPML